MTFDNPRDLVLWTYNAAHEMSEQDVIDDLCTLGSVRIIHIGGLWMIKANETDMDNQSDPDRERTLGAYHTKRTAKIFARGVVDIIKRPYPVH